MKKLLTAAIGVMAIRFFVRPTCSPPVRSGNVLGRGYAAGIGMAVGSVFDRIVGREAALNARN